MTTPEPAPAPAPRVATYRIAMVCLGNICRSPIAEVVMSKKLIDADVDTVVVDSCGTGGWHVGEPMDPRAADMLREHGYDADAHRAQQFLPSWFDDHDLILAMDRANLDEIERQSRSDEDLHMIRMYRSFDPDATSSLDVPDPWYGGRADFESVLEIVERTSDGLIEALVRDS